MTQQPLPLMNDLSQSQEPTISGFTYIPQFLSYDEAANHLRWINTRPTDEWKTDLSRRVIHYGWQYDYQSRQISSDLYLGPLPDIFSKLAMRLFSETGMFLEVPNQVIVNEYEPGQGIAMHTDHPEFGPTVAMVSLGDSWSMDFLHERTGDKQSKLLEVGSALVLGDEARLEWRHGIPKRKSEPGGRKRDTRVSLTFRTVHPQ
ncbi:MAG: alpha-ketoglutarate-dependent dioxygenase AlkB [Acidimicrobiia bacterium]|nr:alpha-ketoglutarate-dependent dioxygenase AlkB [Acidimicrobiia bacterium]MYI29753.1 alpha-ketoglutarate-dependent dioxygenase AlkB [Acidimicrobiia bacterium]